ncbi:MAG: hypothetical protein CMH88_09915 [Oceanibulbus sp.]|jgi:hypothetical protein|uniref:hypothetical protein n=1 Tax=Sulfitobacter dubius TaxID=218673 RepID=UPI000C65CDAD|nr:hypothetical protein [Sulfitobacter sp.]
MAKAKIGTAAPDLDLFGQPLTPIKDRRGRPSYKKTKENQDFVAVRAAAGWSQKMIAEALGCSEKTMRDNFYRELHGGQLIIEGLCLDVLVRRAREGHAPSIGKLLDRLDRVATPPAASKKGEAKKEDAAPVLGKKQQALAEAADPAKEYGDLYARLGKRMAGGERPQ